MRMVLTDEFLQTCCLVSVPLAPLNVMVLPANESVAPLKMMLPPLKVLAPPLKQMMPPLKKMMPPLKKMMPPLKKMMPSLKKMMPPLNVMVLPANESVAPLKMMLPPLKVLVPPLYMEDQREDHFDPDLLPNDDNSIVVGDFNAHHPLWDSTCDAADDVGDRVATWLDRTGWTVLNSGEATRVDSQTAPDIAVCALSLARRTSWLLDDSLGSDHRVMKMTVRSGFSSSRRVRKARWAFKKADWSAWSSECEAALADPPRGATAQQLCTRFTAALQQASARHIPRGARADPKPWAADPELEEAIADRRSAQARVDPAVPETIQHYVETRRRAAEVEARVSRQRFHQMVSEELNKPNSIGRVSKILKRWEGATDDDHRDGQAMEHGGRLLVKDGDKADAFCQTYAWVSRQVRVPKVDRLAKQQRKALTPSTCRECDGARVGCCGAFSMDELVRQLNSLKNLRQKTRPRIAQLKRLTGRDWGLREQQLRAVANGYVRGPQEHAAAAWLPATPASHVEILEREVRAAARVITGCPVSTRTHALLAEAGMPPVSARRLSLAARFLAKARALPREDPLRTVADEVVPARLSSVTGWRQCSDRGCRAGWCRACGEEADTPDHVLLRCPALMNARLRIFGTIFPSLSDVRRDDAVAALARVARYLQSR
ncbi:Dynein assembly factor 3, axonemal [Amphibalanus amphitrite]|uniref:Dynein assembly factor 3, axonemal n=1 Tax=Amphibalanus amphitrite TaxID=1232801 RepID=A0A6A4VAB1_AMPAM|nr:Dynein assembly factor 3, axonemal [Amphibalanus amphitrite]